MKEKEGMLEEIGRLGSLMGNCLQTGRLTTAEFSQHAVLLSECICKSKALIPNIIYKDYEEFFEQFADFCMKCKNEEFLQTNVDTMASSLELFTECIKVLQETWDERRRRCACCGKEVVYNPLSEYYTIMKQKMGVTTVPRAETLNKDEYSCPVCGANDRDRMMISFLKMVNLQKAVEGYRVLQFAPSQNIESWIQTYCPQVAYESTDLFMEKVSFQSDIQDMYMVPDGTYDVLICSHVLEHVQDDRKALQEMHRILKPDGKILFLVPIDLNASFVDEEWGLSEEENWKRFGQGDHCRRYSKLGLRERLKEYFYVHPLGKDYFGEDVFCQNALIDTSTLYVLTKAKNIDLNMDENLCIDEKLCEEGPLVSVILPCYNHEQFVAEAIESVINQSYKNIEILVADDGSTDATPQIMQQYSSYFAKEFYFEENAGGGRAKFLGQYAKGKYVALMHSDDVWDKDKLALQVAYMEKHAECAVCLTWCLYVDENLEELEDTIFLKANRDHYEWMKFFWEKGNALCNPSSLTRRENFQEVQKYGCACRQLPDFFKWVGLIQHAPIHIIPQILIRMRRYQKEGAENTSIFSKENNIRHSVEEGNNWLWVIRDMDSAFFVKSFKELMINPNANTDAEVKCEKYFLMLNHRNIFVQNSAICYFHEIYNEVKECMEEEYHYTKKDFARDEIRKGIGQIFLN